MPKTQNDVVELAFDIEGEGPDLLLISGSASTRAIWRLVRPQLAQSFRTIAFDNRDSGESSIASAPYAFDDLAKDAIAVLDAANSRRAHVLGHSMGGVVAQELGFLQAGRIASLTLVSSLAGSDTYSRNIISFLRSLTESVDDDRVLLAGILFAGAGTTTLRSGSLFDMVDAAMAVGPLAPRSALVRQWDLDTSVDTLPRLAGLTLPVHVVWGSEDRLLQRWHFQQLLETARNAKGTVIDACGHLPMIVAPDEFNRAVVAFLSQVERADV
jgi:pimeloyl-ACP methyl ester carboxylesterase